MTMKSGTFGIHNNDVRSKYTSCIAGSKSRYCGDLSPEFAELQLRISLATVLQRKDYDLVCERLRLYCQHFDLVFSEVRIASLFPLTGQF